MGPEAEGEDRNGFWIVCKEANGAFRLLGLAVLGLGTRASFSTTNEHFHNVGGVVKSLIAWEMIV